VDHGTDPIIKLVHEKTDQSAALKSVDVSPDGEYCELRSGKLICFRDGFDKYIFFFFALCLNQLLNRLYYYIDLSISLRTLKRALNTACTVINHISFFLDPIRP